jgi:hypothetical protein
LDHSNHPGIRWDHQIYQEPDDLKRIPIINKNKKNKQTLQLKKIFFRLLKCVNGVPAGCLLKSIISFNVRHDIDGQKSLGGLGEIARQD